jgi:hypothetical protein
MAGLRLTGFAGFVPRQSPYLLQDNEAQKASNTKLYSNELRPWQRPGPVDPVQNFDFDPLTIYRTVNVAGDNLWLSFDSDVDVMPGPVYDTNNPLFYTGAGDGKPKKTNSTLAQTGTGPFPGDYLLMGVPTPIVTPTVSASGGSGTPENRVYLFTYISLFGSVEEESAPSPTSAQVSVNPGGSVTVAGLPAAAPAGKYNITKVRIYRSVAGSNSNPFLKVADVTIGTTSYVDSLSATSLGVILPSTTWAPPPDGLRGLVSMANGIMAGFVGNDIYFSEPFLPHAWPPGYALSVEYPVVGIAAVGTSLVVTTRGNPFIITGATPASMTQEKLPLYEPCMSKRSISTDEGGAMYASPNGVIKIGPGIADNVTRNLFTRDEWSRYEPSTMTGEIQDGRYFLFYNAGPNPEDRGGLILDRNQTASPLTSTSIYATAAHADPVNAKLYVAESRTIKGWDSDQVNGIPYEWRSKVFVLPRPVSFGAGQIDADFENAYPATKLQSLIDFIKEANQKIWDSVDNLLGAVNTTPINTFVLNGSLLTPIPDIEDRYVLLSVYANGVLRAKIQVKNHQPFRLPSGFKADRWEFQLDGNVPLRYLKIAETSKELANI